MDDRRFDWFARTFAGGGSRRAFLASALGSVTGLVGLAGGEAATCPRGKKRCGQRCISKRQCCKNGECQGKLKGGICRRGKCQCGPAKKRCQGRCISANACCPTCAAGQTCKGGTCCYDSPVALAAALGAGGPAVIPLCPNSTYSGNFTVGRNLTIVGAGKNSTILDGGGIGSVVTVAATVTGAEIRRLGIRNGQGARGAGILNSGTLTIVECEVSRNHSDYIGGGIANEGTLILRQSEVTGNRCDEFDGGGISNATSSSLTLINSRVEFNSAGGRGGGIFNQGHMTVRDASSIHSNDANFGGGIANSGGDVTIEDTSRVTYNMAAFRGGGVFNAVGASLKLVAASRVSYNSAPEGGGVWNNDGATIEFFGPTSCVGPNRVGGNCAGPTAVQCRSC